MRKINQRIVYAIAESLVQGPAGSLELKRMVDKRLNCTLPSDTFYRYKEISKGLGIIDSKPRAKKVRGGYQTLHSLTERGKKLMALGLNLIDPKKYQYHKDNYEIVSVGDWTDDDELYKLFLIMASIDTIESTHIEEIYEPDENELLERLRVLVPTISMNDLVIAEKERRFIDGCIATYYKPVSCLQIWKEEHPASKINIRRQCKKRTVSKNIITNSRATQDQEEQQQSVATDVYVTNCKITFYYVKILGASASDIVRYNKGYGKRGQKFTGMITGPISFTRVQKALSLLEREQLISSIGKLNGETRYEITDETIRRFIGNCLVIHGHIMDLMNRLWSYRIRKIYSYDRRWLEMIYRHNKADKIISSNLAFFDDDLPRFIDERLSREQELLLSLDSSPDSISSSGGGTINDYRKSAAIRREVEETRRRVEEEARALKGYIKKEIQDMQVAYAYTFKEYHFPLERIMQLLILPYLAPSKKQYKN
jgi:hypothetical protein